MLYTKKMALIYCLCAILILISGRVSAELITLAPMQAHVVRTDQQVAVFYYLETGENQFEVISTIMGSAENSIPIRQRVRLNKGQLYTFELNSGVAETAMIKIKFEAETDALKVALN